MERENPVGYRHVVMPGNAILENVVLVDAGALQIGVEPRELTDAMIDDYLVKFPNPEGDEYIRKLRERLGRPIDDRGVSIHVFDTETNDEYLRFDAFQDDPHYHYITPGSHQVSVGYDYVAGEEFHEWIFHALSERVVAMLRECGADELASKADQSLVRAAMPAIRDAVEQARGQLQVAASLSHE
jgi:hypothetical protein